MLTSDLCAASRRQLSFHNACVMELTPVKFVAGSLSEDGLVPEAKGEHGAILPSEELWITTGQRFAILVVLLQPEAPEPSGRRDRGSLLLFRIGVSDYAMARTIAFVLNDRRKQSL
ncbi:hypothetical protein Tco_1184993 [Tanacetum coccineum]